MGPSGPPSIGLLDEKDRRFDGCVRPCGAGVGDAAPVASAEPEGMYPCRGRMGTGPMDGGGESVIDWRRGLADGDVPNVDDDVPRGPPPPEDDQE